MEEKCIILGSSSVVIILNKYFLSIILFSKKFHEELITADPEQTYSVQSAIMWNRYLVVLI